MFSNAILSANYQDDAKEIGEKLLTGEMKHTDPEVMLVYNCMEQFASYLEPGVTGMAYSDAPGRLSPQATWRCMPMVPGPRLTS